MPTSGTTPSTKIGCCLIKNSNFGKSHLGNAEKIRYYDLAIRITIRFLIVVSTIVYLFNIMKLQLLATLNSTQIFKYIEYVASDIQIRVIQS